jgi:hypothetical protein
MGVMDRPGAGPVAFLADVIGDVFMIARNASLNRDLKRAAREAERENRRAEERGRKRHRAWLAAVERQAAERWAGDATEAQARAALSGKRPNPLDKRKFR